MTVPTVAPRFAGDERWAANGTICCATVAVTPTTSDATMTRAAPGAAAVAASARASTTNCPTISLLRSIRSPSGSRRNRPSAYPS